MQERVYQLARAAGMAGHDLFGAMPRVGIYSLRRCCSRWAFSFSKASHVLAKLDAGASMPLDQVSERGGHCGTLPYHDLL